MASVNDLERNERGAGGEIVPVEDKAIEAPAKTKKSSPAKRTPAPVPVQQRGCWGTCALFSGASLLVLVLVFAFLLVVTIVNVSGFLRDPVDNFLAVFGFESNTTPQEVDSQTVVLGIREMALLQARPEERPHQAAGLERRPVRDAEIVLPRHAPPGGPAPAVHEGREVIGVLADGR